MQISIGQDSTVEVSVNKSLTIALVAGTMGFAAAANTGTKAGTTTPDKLTDTRPIGLGSTASPADNKMAQNIRDELKKDATLSNRAQNLRVNAAGGEVMVSGMVESQAERDKVEAVARRVAGDNRVVLDVSVE